jgi:hypothetical protein
MARGNLAYDQIATGSRQGTGTKIQMASSGQTTPGHMAVYDANGSVVDGGAAYTLPVASSSVLGGVKQGNAVYIDSAGVLNTGVTRTLISSAGTYQMTGAEFFVEAAVSGITVALPASPRPGDLYYIAAVNVSTTIDAGSGNTIYTGILGPNTQTMSLYNGQVARLYCVVAGSWFIISYLDSMALAYQTYTPTLSYTGSLSGSAISFPVAEWIRMGPVVLMTIQGLVTLAGAGAVFYVSTPLAPVSSGVRCVSISGGLQSGTAGPLAGFAQTSPNAIAVINAGNFPTGSAYQFFIQGTYRTV